MKAPTHRLAVALVLLSAACVTQRPRGSDMYPPAPPNRAGAPHRGAGPAPGSQARRPAPSSDPVARALTAARGLVGERAVVLGGHDYGAGCEALVLAALDAAGRPVPAGARRSADLHALAAARGALKPLARAAPGDVLFFADRAGGPPAHVGLVERVEDDGTAIVLHRTSRGVVPVRVNGAHPRDPRAPDTGRLVNDAFVVGGKPVPAGSLALGAADFLRG